MYVFLLLLNPRRFQSRKCGKEYETGDPVVCNGEHAIVLGYGLTRAEAKAEGTEYYNRVSKWHDEEVTDWNFETQDVGASAPDSSSSDQETVEKHNAEEPTEGSSPKRRKR